MPRAPISVRLATSDDLRFVCHSWLRAAWKDDRRRRLSWREHRQLVVPQLDSLLTRSDTMTLMAVGDTGFLIGWLCLANPGIPVVHYAYVKGVFRGLGVFETLCEAAGLSAESRLLYTAPGRSARKLAERAAQAEYLPLSEYL
jgi:hypothetical protein